MNKPITPKQLSLGAEMTREEMLLQDLPPNIDPQSPQFKADLEKIDRIDRENAERDSLAGSAANASVRVTLLPSQDETQAYFNTDGDLVLEQRCWPNEDQVILINRDSKDQFLDRLLDLMGIPCLGRS